jgi:rfaE bifunctional protein kinase chain/domain
MSLYPVRDDPMPARRAREISEAISHVRVGVYGDFCLDAYWMLDPRGGEVSAETGLPAQAVGRQACSLGGAANVVANVAALGPSAVRAIGVVGDDVFGRELLRQLGSLCVDTSGMVVQARGFDTVTYGKRYVGDREEPRIDFGFFNARTPETDAALLAHLRRALDECDVVILNQQIPGSLSDAFIDGVNRLTAAGPHAVVVCDSRHHGDRFRRVVRKTNDAEALRLGGRAAERGAAPSLEELERFAAAVSAETGKPVFVTRGARGILTADGPSLFVSPGLQLLGRIDTVGAGDTVTSAVALCLGAGVPPAEAAAFANLAAAVTVQKIFQTGTASPGELLAISEHPDYVYQPELARDIRQASYLEGTEIEVCADPPPSLARVRHAVFDHDGTISTLRQGWEQVMEPVMIRAILGRQYDTAGEDLYGRVVRRVREYIDKSTGIETIVQMEGLLAMIAEFAIVAPSEILDTRGYKAIYNAALMEVVSARVAKLQRGELGLEDLTVKGAVPMLRTLQARGVRLYLASGTDEGDVRREAEALGYAGLFEGGIYGAAGDVATHAKRTIIRRILARHDLDGAQLVIFGDGPVELREARRHGGTAIGIASDEVRRYGLNPDKRTRLVEAGAQYVLPDFSQADRLLALMRHTHA